MAIVIYLIAINNGGSTSLPHEISAEQAYQKYQAVHSCLMFVHRKNGTNIMRPTRP